MPFGPVRFDLDPALIGAHFADELRQRAVVWARPASDKSNSTDEGAAPPQSGTKYRAEVFSN